MYNRIYSLLHLLFNNLVAVMIHRKPTILSMITYDAIAIDHNDDDHFKNGQIAASFCNGLVNGWLPLIKMNNLFVACVQHRHFLFQSSKL